MDARGLLLLVLSALAAGGGDDATNHTGKIVAPHVPEVRKQGFMAAIKNNLQRNNEEYEEGEGAARGAQRGGGALKGAKLALGRANRSAGARRLGPPPRPRLPRVQPQPQRPRAQMLEGTWGREAPGGGAPAEAPRAEDVEGGDGQLAEVIKGKMGSATPGGRKENVTPGQALGMPPMGPEWKQALREGAGAEGEGEEAPGEGEGALQEGEGEGAPAEGEASGLAGANYDAVGEPERERVAAPGGHHPAHGHRAPKLALRGGDAPAGGGEGEGEGDGGGAWDGVGDSPEAAEGAGGGPAVRGRVEAPRGPAPAPAPAAGADRNKVEKLRSFLRNNKDVLKKFILQKRKQKQVANSPLRAGSEPPMTFTPKATSYTPMTFTPDRDLAPMTINPPRAPVGVLTGVLTGQQMAPPWLRRPVVGVGVGVGGGEGGAGVTQGGEPQLDWRGLHALDLQPARGSRIAGMRQQGRGRLCQRNVLMPEGPKYDSKGEVYLLAYNRSRYGGRDYSQTKTPRVLLPVCCNCCRKSVLGCE